MHKNRHNRGNFWPIAKKGTKYVAKSSHNNSSSIPLSVLLRDVCGIVRTTKELKKAINEKMIKVSGKEIRDVKFPVGLFDIVSAGDKTYRVTLGTNKKFKVEESKGKESETKPLKIIGKKNLGKDKIQFNLIDGRNVISKEKAKVGDTAIYNLKDNKIEKVVKMEKGNSAFVIKGKHAGVTGKIGSIVELGGKDIAVIEAEKEKINVWVKNIVVM